MKKRLQLQTVIHIKDDLSRDISELEKDIAKYNNTEKNVSTLREVLAKKKAQIIIIKEAIQQANQGKHADGKTNNYYIYRLSNLNSERVMLGELLQDCNENSQVQKEELEEELQKVLTEIETIRGSLKIFNRDHKVMVELDKDLNLLNE